MTMFLKPATIEFEGAQVLAIVRDPETFIPLAAAGEFKPRSAFWNCRIRDGDVIEVAAPDQPAPAALSPAAD